MKPTLDVKATTVKCKQKNDTKQEGALWEPIALGLGELATRNGFVSNPPIGTPQSPKSQHVRTALSVLPTNDAKSAEARMAPHG